MPRYRTHCQQQSCQGISLSIVVAYDWLIIAPAQNSSGEVAGPLSGQPRSLITSLSRQLTMADDKFDGLRRLVVMAPEDELVSPATKGASCVAAPA